jgi:hypothetical protein
MTIFKRLWLLV